MGAPANGRTGERAKRRTGAPACGRNGERAHRRMARPRRAEIFALPSPIAPSPVRPFALSPSRLSPTSLSTFDQLVRKADPRPISTTSPQLHRSITPLPRSTHCFAPLPGSAPPITFHLPLPLARFPLLPTPHGLRSASRSGLQYGQRRKC
jgi:hypothetical protein